MWPRTKVSSILSLREGIPMVAPIKATSGTVEPIQRSKSRPLPVNGPAYIKVLGRVYKVTPNALRNYFGEYELGGDLFYGFNDCLEHIAQEMEVALGRKPKPVGARGRILQYESQCLLFKLIGSRIMNIRISLRTGEFS